MKFLVKTQVLTFKNCPPESISAYCVLKSKAAEIFCHLSRIEKHMLFLPSV